jgi:hypothetical protein
LAAQVNTALMTQVWLVKNGMLAESDLPNSVFMGGVVQAKTPHFEFLALPDRIQFSTGERTGPEDSGRVAFEKCKSLVNLLPHTPFTALGINFVWFIDTNEPTRQSRAIFASGNGVFEKWFAADDSRFGGYASCKFDGDLRLKLTIGPIVLSERKQECLKAAFNYHADVTGIDGLLRALALWEKARAHSELIASDLDNRVMKCSKS